MRYTFKLCLLLVGVLMSFVLQGNAADNDGFGRLFSRPAERNKLDGLRQSQQLKVITPQEKDQSEDNGDAALSEVLDPITMQGYVKRNDGTKSTLWINRQAVQEDSTVDNVQVGRLNRRGFSSKGASTEGVDVQMPANGKKVRLKAGQMYEPETSQIKELHVIEKAKRLNLEETGVIDGADEKPRY
ncbi:MAG: hypothetical protein V4445_04795 [Pseudomonadota bacterium]